MICSVGDPEVSFLHTSALGSIMKKIIASVFIASVLLVSALAQKTSKPWTDWSEKDAHKILNDSPWGKTQVDADLAEMFYQPTAPTIGDSTRRRDGTLVNTQAGSVNQAMYVKLYVRFLSARPVRQAFVRLMQLQSPSSDPAVAERLGRFANSDSPDWIFVAVAFESKDKRFSTPIMQLFNSRTTGSLKNSTYLERKDGKRLFLSEYSAPGNDGLGAKFSFPRIVNGEPFLTENSGEVRFYSEVADKLTLNIRFDVTAMKYDGRLEY
jgi:hypothetical protein